MSGNEDVISRRIEPLSGLENNQRPVKAAAKLIVVRRVLVINERSGA